ncbi:MAG: hypothetical protein R6T83_03545, partial [Salinibacter sp.]
LLGATYFTQYTSQTSTAASEDQAERQEEVLARQVARSAFSDGMSEAKRNFDTISDGETRRGTYEDGTYELAFAVSSTDEGERTVAVTARGIYPADADAGDREATYYISGTATREGSVNALFNAITSEKEPGFEVDGPGCSGEACVSGIDAGGGDDRHGISLTELENPQEDEDEVCDTFSQKVEGKESGCDVSSRGASTEEWVEEEFDRVSAAIKTLVEEDSDEVTACVDDDDLVEGDDDDGDDGSGGQGVTLSCELKGNEEGDGILYVDDDFKINGNAQWNGLVLAGGDADITISGGGNANNINGGLLMASDADLNMKGGNKIQYNSDQLLKLVDVLPTVGTDQVVLTDRCGGLVPTGEEVPASCR